MNESEKTENYLREVVVNYRGARRKAPVIKDSQSVVTFLKKTLTDNSREHFIVLYLDTVNHVIGFTVSAIGTQKSCPVTVDLSKSCFAWSGELNRCPQSPERLN